MKKRKWLGDPSCSFCNKLESTQHLFFGCSVAKCIRRSIGVALGTELCPANVWQFNVWCYKFLPNLKRFYTIGLPAVVWAIWLARNRATFENENIQTPFDI